MRSPPTLPSSCWIPCCLSSWLHLVTRTGWNSWPASRPFDCPSDAFAVPFADELALFAVVVAVSSVAFGVPFVDELAPSADSVGSSVVLSGRELAPSAVSALHCEKGRFGAVVWSQAVAAASSQSCAAEQPAAVPRVVAFGLVDGTLIVTPAETFAPADAVFVLEGGKSV